jgi:hypothetical protein
MDNKLIDICTKKINKEINDSWTDIAIKYSVYDGIGENLRCAFKKWRKRNGQLKSTHETRDISFENKLEEIDLKTVELKKEKIRLQDTKTKFNQIIRENARKEELFNLIENAVLEVSSSKPLVSVSPITRKTNKTGVLQLSDWHYSIIANNFLNTYNTEIFNRRINGVIKRAIEYGCLYDIEELYVLLQGDFISSGIHNILRIQNQEDIITQIIKTSEVLAEILNELSSCFKLKVSLVTDNHSRVTPDKKDSLEEENYIRITEWYLKTRLVSNKNIKFIENECGLDISTFSIYNFNCGSIHGNKDSFKHVVSNITTFTRQIYDFIFTSHNHHLNIEELSMVTVFSNGSLSGVDSYSADLRLSSHPLQNFVVISKENGLECICPIRVK